MKRKTAKTRSKIAAREKWLFKKEEKSVKTHFLTSLKQTL